MEDARTYQKSEPANLTPLELEIRDLLHETKSFVLRTAADVERARQLVKDLAEYAAQASRAEFPYTAMLLLERRAQLERQLNSARSLRRALASGGLPDSDKSEDTI